MRTDVACGHTYTNEDTYTKPLTSQNAKGPLDLRCRRFPVLPAFLTLLLLLLLLLQRRRRRLQQGAKGTLYLRRRRKARRLLQRQNVS